MTETGIRCSGICAGRAVCRLFCLRCRSVPLHCRIRLGCSGRTGCLSGSRCLLWYISGCGVLCIRAHCSVLRCLSGLSPGCSCSGLCGRRTCNTPGCLGSCRRFNGCRCSGLSHRSLTGHLIPHCGMNSILCSMVLYTTVLRHTSLLRSGGRPLCIPVSRSCGYCLPLCILSGSVCTLPVQALLIGTVYLFSERIRRCAATRHGKLLGIAEILFIS